MKRIILLISILLIFSLLFGACTPSVAPGTEATGESTETTENETGNTAQGGTQEIAYNLPYTLTDSTELTAAELEEFQTLFTGVTQDDRINWHNLLLGCGMNEGFRMPKDVNLRRLFNNGFKWEIPGIDTLTEEERAFLQQQDRYTGKDVVRLPAEKANQVLKTYMGITLADVTKEHVEELMYMPETDCYYIHQAGAAGEVGFRIAYGEREADGTVHLLSVHSEGTHWEEQRVIQLVPAPEGNPVPYYVQSCKEVLRPDDGLFVYDPDNPNFAGWKYADCEPGSLYCIQDDQVGLVTNEPVSLYRYIGGIAFVKTAEPNKLYYANKEDFSDVKLLYESDFGPITSLEAVKSLYLNLAIKIIEDNKRLVVINLSDGTADVVKEMYYLESVAFRFFHKEYENGTATDRFYSWKEATYVVLYGKENEGDPFAEYHYDPRTGEMTAVAVLREFAGMADATQQILKPVEKQYYQDQLTEVYWYFCALGCTFEKPEDISLAYFLYNGLEAEDRQDPSTFTHEEKAFLDAAWGDRYGGDTWSAAHKMPVAKINAALGFLGQLMLSDLQIPEEWVYYDKTDAYYVWRSDAYFTTGVTVTDAVEYPDGTVKVYWETDQPYKNTSTGEIYSNGVKMVMTLGDFANGRFRIFSNVPVQ